jgi:uncharacterized protein YcbK (DUF882 family)
MTKKTKFRHNKKRNTAFLFEALVMEATKAIVKQDEDRKELAISLIRECFTKSSSLYAELALYKALYETAQPDANSARTLIFNVCDDHRRLNHTNVFNEQTDLINRINKTLGSSVYANFVPHYKSLATIAQLFSPNATVQERSLLQEKITALLTPAPIVGDHRIEHVDNIVYHSFVTKFNEKYDQELLSEQKELLSRYIISFADNALSLKAFVNEEIGRLRKVLTEAHTMEEIASDNDMSTGLATVLQRLDSVKEKQLDEDVLRHILKVQALASEVTKS